MSSGYSNRLWQCPFFQSDERQAVRCEGGRVAAADRPPERRYANRYCCSGGGWKKCTIAAALREYYGEDL